MKKLTTIKEKTYAIKKIFGPTIQGEGTLTGRQTFFLRFAGCNQWNGKPEDREASACPFCDTDFLGGDKMTAIEIVDELRKLRGDNSSSHASMTVTISGGEPLLQLDENLAQEIAWAGFILAVETNGTVPMTDDVHKWVNNVTCSPKVPRSEMKLERKHISEVKILFPHPSKKIVPEDFDDFQVKYLQPVNDVDDIDEESLKKCLEKLKKMPTWRLSLQIHKLIGVE